MDKFQSGSLSSCPFPGDHPHSLSLSLSLDYQIVLTFSLSLSGSSSSDIYRCWIGLFISLRLLALIRLLLLLPHSMVSLVTISQQLWSRWWHSSLQKECVLQLGMYRMTARRDPTDRGERMLVIWYWTQPVVYSRAVADGSGIANGMFSLHFLFFLPPIRMLGSGIRWSNLHPQRLLESMKSFNFNFPFDTLDDFMKRVSPFIPFD